MPADLVRDLIARWPEPHSRHVPLLQKAGVSAVVLEKPDRSFSEACRIARIQVMLSDDLQFVDANSVGARDGSKPLVLTEGSWPGVARDPAVSGRDVEIASASRDPWVELNSYWVPYLKALHPTQPALLAYAPDPGSRAVPFDSLELALIEARSFGGNYILALESTYRKALIGGDPKALAAWAQLGRTTQWLCERESLLGQPISPLVVQLVEPGGETPEIAKLMYRRNVSPTLESAPRLPPPDPTRRLVIVAVDLKSLDDPARKRILAHADAGATVVANGAGWPISQLRRLRADEDRDIFETGKGRLVVYREPISDPSEFAMDVIDLLSHKRRAVRLWNAPAVVAIATAKGVLHCINYGSPVNTAFQVRMQGAFTKATLLRPDAAQTELKVALRGTTSEILIPELRRFGIVVFR